MKAKDITTIALFVVLMIAGAYIKIPFGYINVTFQGFFAILSGPILGPKKAGIAMLMYLFMGLIGLPVFSAGGGLGYVVTPSFGYIIGFIGGGVLTGYLFEKYHPIGFFKSFLIFLSGTIVIYLFGLPYSYAVFYFYFDRTDLAFFAFLSSMLIYLLKDVILCILAYWIIDKIRVILPGYYHTKK